MIGIDTNVLLRIFAAAADDPAQVRAARDLLRAEAPVFLNPIVLAEFAWTLRRTYKLDRPAIHARLSSIASAPEFTLMFPGAILRAVELYRRGPADFADYLIGEIDGAMGCSTAVTFDKDAAKSPSFTELTP
jgi:predicted nucleic-acid-binding protein